MTLEIIKNGAVINEPRYLDTFCFNGQEYAQAPSYMAWKAGALWVAKLVIGGKPAELKPIQTLIDLRVKTGGAQNSIDTLLTGTIICMTPGNEGGLRAHMYDTCREEQIELANHPDLVSGYMITLQIDLKTDNLTKRVIESSEDTKRSFDVPAKNIAEYVRVDENGRSDYNAKEECQKVLTVDGAKQNGASIHAKLQQDDSKGYLLFARTPIEVGKMQVRPLRLGGDDGYYIDYVNTDVVDYGGYGRVLGGSVGEKISP